MCKIFIFIDSPKKLIFNVGVETKKKKVMIKLCQLQVGNVRKSCQQKVK
jgi:hypothetical protein